MHVIQNFISECQFISITNQLKYKYEVNPSEAVDRIFCLHEVNITAVDVLLSYITKSSIAMILTEQEIHIIVFLEITLQPECLEIISMV